VKRSNSVGRCSSCGYTKVTSWSMRLILNVIRFETRLMILRFPWRSKVMGQRLRIQKTERTSVDRDLVFFPS